MYTNKSVVEITVQVKAFTLHQDITHANNALYYDHVVFWVIMCRDKKCLFF